MSKPATRSKRKAQKAKHKKRMKKLAAKREARVARREAAQKPLGSQIMQDEQNATPAQEATVEQEVPITEPIDGELVEGAEEETTEHVEAESTTETTTEVQAEPGTSVIPASASAEEDDSL